MEIDAFQSLCNMLGRMTLFISTTARKLLWSFPPFGLKPCLQACSEHINIIKAVCNCTAHRSVNWQGFTYTRPDNYVAVGSSFLHCQFSFQVQSIIPIFLGWYNPKTNCLFGSCEEKRGETCAQLGLAGKQVHYLSCHSLCEGITYTHILWRDNTYAHSVMG